MQRVSPTSLASLLPISAAIAFGTACGATLPVVDVLPLADTTDTAGPYEITAVVADSDRVVAAWVLWFTGDTTAPQMVPLVRQKTSDIWSAGLPGQPEGSTIRWRVEVETDEGELVRVPTGKNDDSSFTTWTFHVLAAH